MRCKVHKLDQILKPRLPTSMLFAHQSGPPSCTLIARHAISKEFRPKSQRGSRKKICQDLTSLGDTNASLRLLPTCYVMLTEASVRKLTSASAIQDQGTAQDDGCRSRVTMQLKATQRPTEAMPALLGMC